MANSRLAPLRGADGGVGLLFGAGAAAARFSASDFGCVWGQSNLLECARSKQPTGPRATITEENSAADGDPKQMSRTSSTPDNAGEIQPHSFFSKFSLSIRRSIFSTFGALDLKVYDEPLSHLISTACHHLIDRLFFDDMDVYQLVSTTNIEDVISHRTPC